MCLKRRRQVLARRRRDRGGSASIVSACSAPPRATLPAGEIATEGNSGLARDRGSEGKLQRSAEGDSPILLPGQPQNRDSPLEEREQSPLPPSASSAISAVTFVTLHL